MKITVIGAGIAGLTAALRLARAGHDVTIVEARDDAGGLAGAVEIAGRRFDAGPYVLLDRPGLEWALEQIDVAMPQLQRLDNVVYEVTWDDAPPLRIYADAERTAHEMGSARYLPFVAKMRRMYARLAPLLRVSKPRPWMAIGAIPFLLRSLGSVMRGSGLPPRAIEALTIWTHVAGQDLDTAPSPMAFVPALIHTFGAWVPRDGTAAIARALRDAAIARGIAFRYGTRVTRIATKNGRVVALHAANGEVIVTNAVVSDAHAVGTYVDLLDATPPRRRASLQRIPLQSPGACAYLSVVTPSVSEAPPTAPGPSLTLGVTSNYLRFRLPAPPPAGSSGPRFLGFLGARGAPRNRGTRGTRGTEERPGCRLFAHRGDTARLIVPIAYERAQALGRDGQLRVLDDALAESWWRDGIASHDVLLRRTPADWGAHYALYRDSMNAAMTAAFMRRGRIAHRSPDAHGLYLAGSSTHPGQWISFCATSGVLAADALLDDVARNI